MCNGPRVLTRRLADGSTITRVSDQGTSIALEVVVSAARLQKLLSLGRFISAGYRLPVAGGSSERSS